MNHLTIVECHNLTNKNVKERLSRYIDNIRLSNDSVVDLADIEWQGNLGKLKFTIAGMKFTGDIKVEDEFLTIKGILPPIATEYYDQLEQIIRYQLYHLLN